MEPIFQAIIIGVVQGLTEFLPISSSAHLTLLPPLLGWDDPLIDNATFVVMLHVGTLLALVTYFWADMLRLIRAGLASVRARSIGDDPDRRLAWLLLVSAVPAAVVGALFEPFFDTYFRENLWLVPLTLALGALMLWVAERLATLARGLDAASAGDAVVIGLAQALALFPGISRSGVTIAAGLVRGLQREAAARFAFLMGIPIIAGAGLWKARTLVTAPDGSYDWAVLLAGMAAAAISGWFAIGFLLRYLRTRSTFIFICYRLIAAVVFTLLLLAR